MVERAAPSGRDLRSGRGAEDPHPRFLLAVRTAARERDSPSFSYCTGCPPDFITASSPNRTEAFDPELTTEAVVGVQHSFLPELVVGASYTYRDRSIETNAFQVNFIKRLSDQWMARGYFAWDRGEWDVPADYIAGTDPNPNEFGSGISGTLYGEDVGTRSDAKGDVFLQSTWSWNLNGMYQFAPDRPYRFNIAANLYGREGYPLPYY